MMDAVTVLKTGLADAHWFLDQTMEGLTPEHLHWAPPGTANTIASIYAHTIGSEDAFVQGTLLGNSSLAEGEWRERTGLSLPIPQRGSDWFAWSRRVQVDLPAARHYAGAVYAATDAYLATLSPEQLDRPPDVALPGNQNLCWLLTNFLVLHASGHAGEVSVLRGLQGLPGL